MKLIDFKGVSFGYKNGDHFSLVVKNIDFQVNTGEMVAITGPSGSGKSTLLYVIAGLLRAQSGNMAVLDTCLKKADSDQLAAFRREHLGFVFQQFHLLPTATVLDNILLGIAYKKQDAAERRGSHHEAVKIAKKLGIESYLERFPNELSGGQQQRVAIARALIKKPSIILADEPTGNLDSENTQEIMKIFQALHTDGHTIIMITHDSQVAASASRQVEIKDGCLTGNHTLPKTAKVNPKDSDTIHHKNNLQSPVRDILSAWANIKRNKMRSFLTMLGVTIGIASVLAMTTVGEFTKSHILSGFESMGSNKLRILGYRNWNMKAQDKVPQFFKGFNEKTDYKYLPKLFPQIKYISPSLAMGWSAKAFFGGKQIKDINVMGVAPDFFPITNRKIILGKSFSKLQVKAQMGVCIVGQEIYQSLFKKHKPIGKNLSLDLGQDKLNCRIIGVLAPQSSNETWEKPNKAIYVPYSYVQKSTRNNYTKSIRHLFIKTGSGSDVEKLSGKIKAYFKTKYGASGNFSVNGDDIMAAQVKRFLTMFSILLACIGGISLTVGGIGIANMMLVTVAERMREIGLRKALGATDRQITQLFLAESILLCVVAGCGGLVVGFATYQSMLFLAAKLVDNIEFTWVFLPWPIAVALISTVSVGILSGIVPAIKARKLEVLQALRQDH